MRHIARKTACVLLALLIVFSLLPNARAAEYSYENMLRDLASLENYANSYHDAHSGSDSPLRLILIYIRSGRYQSGIWNTAAGSVDMAFAAYVTQMDSQNGTYTALLKKLGDILLPNGERTDAVHMFATMNMIDTGFGDLGGWGGDLCSMMQDMASMSGSLDELTAIAAARLGSSEGQFGQQDLIADLDAANIMAAVNESTSLTAAVSLYFGTSYSEYRRVTGFLSNRFPDTELTVADLRSSVLSQYRTAAGVSLLEITNGVSGKTDLRKACCYAFADYLNKAATGFRLSYRWADDSPSSVTLPVNRALYADESSALAGIDASPAAGTEHYENRGSENGVWRFSGWSAAGNTDHVISVEGSWTFSALPAPEIILVGGKPDSSGVSTVSVMLRSSGEIDRCTFVLTYPDTLSPKAEKLRDCTISAGTGSTTVTIDHSMGSGVVCPMKLTFRDAADSTVTVSSFDAYYACGKQLPDTLTAPLTMGSSPIVLQLCGTDCLRVIDTGYAGTQAADCTIVLAGYDAEGRMVMCEPFAKPDLTGGYTDIPLTIHNEQIREIRVFALISDSLLPAAVGVTMQRGIE